MKKTTHYTGHRWTTQELQTLMRLWADEVQLFDIAEQLKVTTHAVLHIVGRMRKEGVPLARRKRGHVAGRANKPWSQGEVEFLMRKREEKATSEEIAVSLGRSFNSVSAMIATLRKEGVPVAMRGMGVRRLWNAESLKAVAAQRPETKIIQMEATA